MSLADRAWEAFRSIALMQERLQALGETVKGQQQRIESLTERVIRLETTIELMLRGSPAPRLTDER